MPHPLTLLQISGRGYPPAPSAEHLADHRCPGRVPQRRPAPARFDAAAAEIGVLVQAARASGTPIVHVRHLGIQGGLFDPQGSRGQFLPELQPEAGEKSWRNACPRLSGTELHDLLQNHGRLDLIVCGFMTHSSVSTTVRAAKDYGYRCTLADSACATRDIPTLNGGVLSAADPQRAEIAAPATTSRRSSPRPGNCSDRPSSRPPVPPCGGLVCLQGHGLRREDEWRTVCPRLPESGNPAGRFRS